MLIFFIKNKIPNSKFHARLTYLLLSNCVRTSPTKALPSTTKVQAFTLERYVLFATMVMLTPYRGLELKEREETYLHMGTHGKLMREMGVEC